MNLYELGKLGRISPEDENHLNVGDVIICKDADECVEIMSELEGEGYQTDFIYEYNGKKCIGIKILEDETL